MQNDTVWKIPTYIFEVLIIDCGGGQVSDGIDVASVWIGPGTRVALVVENNAKQDDGPGMNSNSDTVGAQSCHAWKK